MRQILLVLVLGRLACVGHGSRLQHSIHGSQGHSGKDSQKVIAPEQQQPQEGAKPQLRGGEQKILALLLMALLVCSLCLGCACYTASRGSGRQNASPNQPTLPPSGAMSPSAGNSNTNGLGWWALKVPGAVWPSFLEKEGKFHRFVAENDPTFQKYIFNEVTGYSCKTPEEFRGTRRDGVYDGSFRVQFTLPEKDNEPKTIEFMRSREEDKPAFGAVKVALPVDLTVFSKDSRLVVKRVSKGSNADTARIREGDIIRAVSLTETEDTQEEAPRWSSMFSHTPVPAPEEGLAILDGRSVADYNAVLQENSRAHGKQAQVVLLIERPDKFGSRELGDSQSKTQLDPALASTATAEEGEENDSRQQGSLNQGGGDSTRT